MSKRKYIGILIMSIFVSCVPLYAIGMETYSEEEVIEETIVHINPMYADEISEEELLHESTDYSDEYLTDIKSVRSVSEMIEYVREEMVKRQTKIVVSCEEEMTSEVWDRVFEEIFIDTGNPMEGDYLNSHYGGMSASYGGTNIIQFDVKYKTTLEQEKIVTTKVQELIKGFGFTSSTSEFEKVLTIYDWICDHVTYDYDNLEDSSYKLKYTAYAALVDRTSVCQGYAALLYRLCREVGIDVRMICGYGDGGRHAWNIVCVDGIYYNMDATWDAGRTWGPYLWFLTGTKNFGRHTRDAEYTTEAFNQRYPMAYNDYDQGDESGQITYSISYDANGGTGAPASQLKKAGASQILSSNKPTRSHVITMNSNSWWEIDDKTEVRTKTVYELFKGWNTRADGTGKTYQPGTTYSTDKDLTLYAMWEPTMIGDLWEPTREGYSFDGWYAWGDYLISENDKLTEDIIAYAEWSKQQVYYTVVLDPNGGEGKPESQKVKEYENVVFPDEPPIRKGYLFIGWTTEKEGGWLIQSEYSVFEDITLYAQWEKIDTSRQDVENFVKQLYNVCLDRNPDPVGLDDWTYKLVSRQIDGVTAAYGFVFSPEFKGKNLCNEDYVKQLYSAFLGRTPDKVGLADWVSQLENGTTREAIFNGFALSQEFKGLCDKYGINQGAGIDIPANGTVPEGECAICGKKEGVNVDGIMGFVQRLYKVCLNRDADAVGLNDWTNKLRNHTATGRSVAYGFIFSQEFIGKNYNNSDYVEYLYNAFMGRGSDPSGKTDWLNRMDKGWTREQVFDGFVGSQEFTGICNSYGITRD